MMRHLIWTVALGCAAALANPALLIAQAKPPVAKPVPAAGAAKTTLSSYVKQQVAATLDEAEKTGDLSAATASLATLFDQVIAYSRDTSADDLREVDFPLRMVRHLSQLPSDRQKELLTYLRANDALARTLVFIFKEDEQKAADVYGMLDTLRQQRGEMLPKYVELTAAICVVHGRKMERRINENTAKSAEPIEIFDYYVKNESKMYFGIKNVPAELLIWVVDTTASVEEMSWALAKYAGDREIGKHFFDVKYDYDHLRKGTPKAVTQNGFTLPNILKYGGVCADQAYFAMGIGKAIGVPTAYATGAAGEAGHAWVGFLQADRSRGWWNFDVGRYAAYRGVRGSVIDPQTRKSIPDSQVSLLGELIGTKAPDRHTAVALTDAARRLIELEAKGETLTAPALPEDVQASGVRPEHRKAAIADALGLIELSLKRSAGYAPAWFTVRDLAKDNKLAIKEKRRWADLLQRLGGPKYPDFTLSILTPMIETIEDHKEQNALWNAVFTMFQNRFDLAASIRMSQGAAWEAQNNVPNAGKCYMDVIERYANAGPFVLEALSRAEKLLVDSGQEAKVLVLYEMTWTKIPVPKEMNEQVTAGSNWHRVGKMYADRLAKAGEAAKAADVEAQLKDPAAARSKVKPASGR